MTSQNQNKISGTVRSNQSVIKIDSPKGKVLMDYDTLVDELEKIVAEVEPKTDPEVYKRVDEDFDLSDGDIM